jgi:SAM-dependent methyltransferase
MRLVCPQCRGSVRKDAEAYFCAACSRVYPEICGIPDFRLFPDPYIDISADREKARHLAAATTGMSFEQAVRYYYSITPDDPADLAEVWTARAVSEVDIANAFLRDCPLTGLVLDVGCSTGAMLVAASAAAGTDIALRWLIIGKLRLRESGCKAQLVCANAEHLPFPDDAFDALTCLDTLEHLRDPLAALKDFRRVATQLVVTSNNRWCLLPEPHVHLWGVGLLPRSLQRRYVAWRRPDLHPYRITLRGPAEGLALARAAGWENARQESAPLHAPHLRHVFRLALRVYQSVRRFPGLIWLAPRWLVKASR